MGRNITLQISGLKPYEILFLKNKLDKQNFIYTDETLTQMQLKVQDSFNHVEFANFLNKLLSNVEEKDIYPLPESCYFDPNNAFIKCIDKIYNLGKRELHFLEMLFFEKSIVTYEQMNKKLWNKEKDFKLNSIRLFVRDIKKKLPKNSITNVQGMGYKLTYQKF